VGAGASEENLVPVAEAARELRIEARDPARWLRRYLRQRERELGAELLVRVGQGRRRPTYRVAWRRVQVACPELFRGRDPVLAALDESRRQVGRLERRLEALEERLIETKATLLAGMREVALEVRRR
jgi:hypothetical protein